MPVNGDEKKNMALRPIKNRVFFIYRASTHIVTRGLGFGCLNQSSSDLVLNFRTGGSACNHLNSSKNNQFTLKKIPLELTSAYMILPKLHFIIRKTFSWHQFLLFSRSGRVLSVVKVSLGLRAKIHVSIVLRDNA